MITNKPLRLIPLGFTVCFFMLCAANISSGQPSPNPGKETKLIPIDPKPTANYEKLEGADGYTLRWRNQFGEVCKEEKHNRLGVKLETKYILLKYPSGQTAKERVETFGQRGEQFEQHLSTEERDLDSQGRTTRSATIEFDDHGKIKKVVKENGQTKIYKPIPFSLDGWREVFQDTTVEQPDVQPKEKKDEGPKFPTHVVDPCVIGEWETATVSGSVTGGNGFRLTIKSDGTQVVDYSTMQVLHLKDLTYRYGGSAEGLLETKNGVAKNLAIKQAGVTLSMGNINGEHARLRTWAPGRSASIRTTTATAVRVTDLTTSLKTLEETFFCRSP